MFSTETREETIVRLYTSGSTISQIRRKTGIRLQKIKKVIEYFDENHSIPAPTVRGRPPLSTNDTIARIMALTVENRSLPCWAISKKFGIVFLKNQLID